ncbi:hypothetical protein [Cryptosporangium phraense]|uniref:hypothetical protein n=1 Tax=Cryptosporangium phraense TaxID=2593070 RepID=UPI00147906B6|nr:hypothetical protein [Cryptosporangium phraense]
MPGPWHTTRLPSPVSHTVCSGTAVAVTVNPGTAALADRAVHHSAGTQNHAGSPTS